MEITPELLVGIQNTYYNYVFLVKNINDQDRFDELCVQTANKYYNKPSIFRKNIRIDNYFNISETEYTFHNQKIYKIKFEM